MKSRYKPWWDGGGPTEQEDKCESWEKCCAQRCLQRLVHGTAAWNVLPQQCIATGVQPRQSRVAKSITNYGWRFAARHFGASSQWSFARQQRRRFGKWRSLRGRRAFVGTAVKHQEGLEVQRLIAWLCVFRAARESLSCSCYFRSGAARCEQ